MKFTACIIIVLATFYGCQKKVTYPEYYGTWKRVDTPSSKKEFYSDGKYKEKLQDTIEVFSECKPTYKIYKYNDTTWVETVWRNMPLYKVGGVKKVRKFTTNHALQINGDYFTNITFKARRDPLKNHIDEYGVWVRDIPNPTRNEYVGKKIIYVFPKNFVGAAWIAFNQANGIPPEYDGDGNPIIRIPENGILQTKLHEDAFATANGYYSIVKEDGDKLIPLKSFDKFERLDSTCFQIKDTIAIVHGFNQRPRESINEKIYHKEISGNILSIYVGNLSWDEEREEWAHPPTLVQKN